MRSVWIMSIDPVGRGVCSTPAMDATVRHVSPARTLVTLHAVLATTLPSIFGLRRCPSSLSESSSTSSVAAALSFIGEGISDTCGDLMGSCGCVIS